MEDINKKIQEAYINNIVEPQLGIIREDWDNISENVDTAAVSELVMFVDNDGNLYRQMVVPWHKNLITKVARGQFKYDLAVKGLAKNLFTEAAKRYSKQFSDGNDWNSMFTTATRTEAAKEWLDSFLDEAELGSYDEYLPKKYKEAGTSDIDFKKLRK